MAEGFGIAYTRIERRSFNDQAMEAELLSRVRSALDAAGAWEEVNTD